MQKANIWLVEHPISQYNEDVKRLARQNELKIVDARFDVAEEYLAKDTPKLTKKGAKRAASKKSGE